MAVASVQVNAQLEVPTEANVPVLAGGPVQMTSCTRSQNTFSRAHYKIVDIDNDFADKVIKQFLGYVDYNHSIFTQGEIDDIYNNRERILRALNYCDLSYPYELYNAALRKRFNKYSYFISAVKEGIDTSGSRTISLDRRKTPYVEDENALKALWHDEITNEYINQILNDKTPEEATKKLVKRYEAALKKLVQTKSEDAFSIYENSYATAIDPHTNYFSPQDSQNFEDDINLSLEGIGAVLSSEDENISIVSIIPGSPAEASKKLKPKDRIVGVRQEDGTYDDIVGWRLSDAVKKIKGRKGTTVTLDIERGEGSSAKAFQVELVRDKIKLQDRAAKGEVKTAADGTKIGVLSVKSFYNGLTTDMDKEISKLMLENVKGLVIDLRNNGGGLLPEAISSTGLFITQGPIVQVRDALGNVLPQMNTDDQVKYSGPLVVAINRLSASSSEIMAAALKDYGRALIIGSTTFGKGTVQRSSPLARPYDFTDQELGSINYTIAKFYRINGGSTQLKGVEPDLQMQRLVDEEEYGEKTENNALPWDKIEPLKYDSYGNVGMFVPELLRLHEEHAAKNPAFKIFRDDMQRYKEVKEKNSLSLNLAERRKKKQEQDEYTLGTTNIRLKLMGKPKIAKLKDLPDDFEFDDPILLESVNIAADYARMLSSSQSAMASVSVLTRFAPPKLKESN
ncbi:MAG: carboxy terminal-processing peptidase [Succinivibrio sp.]|nr:carboxy terminal-processing peptidase [Succinivibrio sp.]